MDVISFFSGTYAEARRKFLEASAAKALVVDSYQNPSCKGREGEDLFMDVARVGAPNASRLLVLSSGTHGIEGYCGSGIQVGLLQSDTFSQLPDDVGVILIHAVNPYGFSHDRRVNEDNIDLNRNYVDFSKPLPGNEHYSSLHQYILPEEWSGTSRDVADDGLAAFVKENGGKAFTAAVSGGQYAHPDGVFYGGAADSWSRTTLQEIVSSLATSVDCVGFIDFHTGLGPFGQGEIIGLGSPEQLARTLDWYGDQVTNPDAGTSSSAPVVGTMGHAMSDAFPNSPSTFIALEYGTLAPKEVLEAVRADNWLYQKGDVESELGRSIKKQIREAFYPDDADWRQKVWDRACDVVDRALDKLIVK